MPVFNLCLKIIKKNLPILSIYLVIFLVNSVMVTGTAASEQNEMTSFTPAKADIAFFSREDTPLVQGLSAELAKVANFVDLPDEQNALQDALYFRHITAVVRIESGFTERFMNGDHVSVKTTTIPNSYSSAYLQMSIDQYLNTARLYVGWSDGISAEELVDRVEKDLAVNAAVKVLETASRQADTNYSVFYFNYLAYSLLSVLILGVGYIMLNLNNPEIQMRNNASPLSVAQISSQIIMALLLFTFLSWFIMLVFSFILNFENSFNKNTIYFLLNSFAFTFTGAGLSFLIGNAVKSKDAISAVSNVVALGSSFISGVFVPQEFLGDFVLKIAAITPSYWYVRANNQIGALSQFDFSRLRPSLLCMVIQIGFGILFLIIGMILMSKKRVRR